MRAVIQRVLRGKVTVSDEVVGEIGPGLVILLGVGNEDEMADATYLAEKVAQLRIFSDQDGKMNCSVMELGLPLLVVSQFTLYGDCRRGRRPDFTGAAGPEIAEKLYQSFCDKMSMSGLQVINGRFRSHMIVEIVNDGPVTILLDSHKKF